MCCYLHGLAELEVVIAQIKRNPHPTESPFEIGLIIMVI
jgi:hypothetical protein